MAELHNMPWIMAGDFNEPLIKEDKYGGKGVHVNHSLAFKDCLDFCNMVDMGFSGPRYTWSNKRELNNLILERIDRFFMRVIARIYGVQKFLTAHPNTDLINLEKHLHQELDLLLDQEHNLWALKSRIN